MKTKQSWPIFALQHPRFWPLLFAFACLRLAIQLPFNTQLAMGRALGRLMKHLLRRRRQVAEVNIRLAFPQLTESEVRALVHKHFLSLGMGIFEMGMAWWAPDRRFRDRYILQGMEHLQAGLAGGHGVILYNAHFTTLDIGVRLFIIATQQPVHMTYRPHNDPVQERFITRNRLRHGEGSADYTNIRGMLRSLKKNRPLWYAPDQGYRGKSAAYVPFFGIPASSATGTSRLAKMSGASVVPFFVRRSQDNRSYVITIHEPMKDFPSDDPIRDTLRFHHLIEQQVELAPEQYLWVHRRFKHLPPDYPSVYQIPVTELAAVQRVSVESETSSSPTITSGGEE